MLNVDHTSGQLLSKALLRDAITTRFFVNNKAQVKRKSLVFQLILCDVTPTSAE